MYQYPYVLKSLVRLGLECALAPGHIREHWTDDHRKLCDDFELKLVVTGGAFQSPVPIPEFKAVAGWSYGDFTDS